MIRLNLSPEPAWLDLGGGVRLRLAPLTSALIGAARSDLQVENLPEDAPADQGAVALAKAIGSPAILDWEGVGNAEGYPVPPTPEAVPALLDLFPLFQRFQTDYVAERLILNQKPTVSSALRCLGPALWRSTSTAFKQASGPVHEDAFPWRAPKSRAGHGAHFMGGLHAFGSKLAWDAPRHERYGSRSACSRG